MNSVIGNGNPTMEQLTTIIPEMHEMQREILVLYQNMQKSARDLTQAMVEGRGDFGRLTVQSQEAIQAYTELRERAVQVMLDGHAALCTEAQHARENGVQLDEEVAEVWSPLNVDEYTPDRIIGDIDVLCEGISHLRVAVEHFEEIQSQISEALTELKWEVDRLERLGIDVRSERRTIDNLFVSARDVNEPRKPILDNINSLVEIWRERSNEHVQQLLTEAIDQLLIVFERLQALGVETEEDQGQIQALNDQRVSPDESLLDLARELHQRFVQRVSQRRIELEQQIEKYIEEARQLRVSLDGSMTEAKMLDEILDEQSILVETKMLEYVERLTASIEVARNAGINVLRRYEQTNTSDVIDERQAQFLGSAMLTSAHLPEMYTEQLWRIGEDVLLRMLFADLDANNFYELFGYGIIARAFKAAIEHTEFVKALNIFSTGFMPPTIREETEQIVAVLSHSDVREVLEAFPDLGTPHLSKEQIQGLSAQNIRSIVIFLEHANVAGIPISRRLQWLASILHERTLEPETHQRASILLLHLLLESGRYLSLYYALCALETIYPDFWQQATLRPMLAPIIERAISLGADGKEFLADLCNADGPGKLAEGDFESEFLLAATAHYLDIHWGYTSLLPVAWSFWDRIHTNYPVLSDFLLRQLQYEMVDDELVNQDSLELEAMFDQLIRDIDAHLQSPQHLGIRAAIQIHQFYAQKVVSHVRQLTDSELDLTSINELSKEVEELLQISDLVEESPIQQREVHENGRPVYEPLKSQVNARLTELLGLLQRALLCKRRILKLQNNGEPSQGKLSDDVSRLRERSELTQWTMQVIIEPLIPRTSLP